MATIGDGVEVRRSSRTTALGGAVDGVFATRAFAAGEYVTRYALAEPPYTDDPALENAYRLSVPGGQLRAEGPRRVMIGASEPRAGLGGGSFINDTINIQASILASDASSRVQYERTARHNTEFVVVVTQAQYEDMRARRRRVTSVVATLIRATADVAAGRELFIDYGREYWRVILQQALIRFREMLGNPVPLGRIDPACVASAVAVDTDAARSLTSRPYLVLRHAPTKGLGVFACARLRAQVYLDRYQGRVTLDEPPDTDTYVVEVRDEKIAGGTEHYISALKADVVADLVPVDIGKGVSESKYFGLQVPSGLGHEHRDGRRAR